jgi:hypothetical protein
VRDLEEMTSGTIVYDCGWAGGALCEINCFANIS